MSKIDLLHEKRPQVICFGEALLDRLGPIGGDPLKDKPTEDCLGGAPANVACALARLGIKVSFVGSLGKDFVGNDFTNLMIDRGINLDGLQLNLTRPTRIVLVRRDDNGERSFQGFQKDYGQGYADQGINLGELTDIWPLIATNASWFVIGTIPLASKASSESLLWSLDKAVLSGMKIALDVNWRPTFWDTNQSLDRGPNNYELEKINKLLTKISLLKLSLEEAIWIFNSSDPIAISNTLSQRPDVVVTNGPEKIRWFISGFAGETEALSPQKIIDTTGAGDAFTAGLIYKLLTTISYDSKIEKIKQAVYFAAGCGALVCAGAGAIQPQPYQSDVEEFLNLDSGDMN